MEINNVESFLGYYERIRERTLKVIKCIPPDVINWTYKDGKFTLGDLVRHIAAIERNMYGETLSGRPSAYKGCGPELANGYEDILSYFNEMHRQTVEILEKFKPKDLQSKCKTPGGAEITVWKWLRAMIEHEIHHRGQIYTYLGMLGITTPPLYGLTSEQVADQSN